MRTLWALLAAALLTIGLVGCQSDAGSSATSGEPDASTKAGSGAAGFPRTVSHAMGETEIPTKPTRVVALDQTFVDASVSLKTPVVGYTVIYGMEGGKLPDYLGDGLQYAKDAVSVGELAEPSLEKIAELQPDLILSAQIRHESLYQQLSKIAPTVFSGGTGVEWKQILQLVGESTGEEERAEELLADFEERAAAIGENIKAERGQLPEISIARFSGGPTIRLYVEESYAGYVLKDVGFPRPEGQPSETDTVFVEVSQENIPDLDAEVIFVSTWSDPAVLKDKKKIMSNPLWHNLEGTQHVVDDNVWMTAVGLQGAQALLDDVAAIFEVDPVSDLR